MTLFDLTALGRHVLSSDRLDLETLDQSVLDDMFEYSKDPRLYRHFEIPPQATRNDTRAYIAKLEARMAAGNAHYWAVHERAIGRMIGSVGALEIDPRKRDCQVGYGINPDYWRRGYFSEALGLVIGSLFFEHHFHRISAVTQSDNLASINGLRGLGFHIEGTLRDYYLDYRGVRHDAILLAILRSDTDAQRFNARGPHV